MKTQTDIPRETREQLERLLMILRRSPEGILLIDRRHVVEYANPAWAKMHGYVSAGELIGQPLRFFHTDQQMKGEVYSFLEMVDLIGRYDKRLHRRRADQSEFSADTTAFHMLDEDGAVVGYVLYAANTVPQDRQSRRPAGGDSVKTMEHCT